MTGRSIPIDEVVVGGRLRATDDAHVETLMESIREVGLLHTITVAERGEGGFPLIAGAHRLEACKRLGHTEIEANVVTLSELQQKLAECDENLAGTVLTPTERALFTSMRKSVYEALHPETKHGGDRRSEDFKSSNCGLASFTRDTVAKTKRSRSSVERDAHRGRAILPEVLAAVKGTEFDTGTYLDKLAKLAHEDQRKVGEFMKSDNPVGARVTLNTTDPPAPEGDNVRHFPSAMTHIVRRELGRLAQAWDDASEETRQRFLRRLEKRGLKVPRVG